MIERLLTGFINGIVEILRSSRRDICSRMFCVIDRTKRRVDTTKIIQVLWVDWISILDNKLRNYACLQCDTISTFQPLLKPQEKFVRSASADITVFPNSFNQHSMVNIFVQSTLNGSSYQHQWSTWYFNLINEFPTSHEARMRLYTSI